jgi:gluconolactonase
MLVAVTDHAVERYLQRVAGRLDPRAEIAGRVNRAWAAGLVSPGTDRATVLVRDVRDRSLVFVCRHDRPRDEVVVVTLWEVGSDARVPRRYTDALARVGSGRRRDESEGRMGALRELASGLEFPEGPVAMSDGSVIVTEIKGGRITRVSPDGSKSTVAEPGGGPNGLAVGPDGKLYCTNNGGAFSWADVEGLTIPGETPETWDGGRIERIDIDSGEVEVIYTECGGHGLRGPNDLVFDRDGGFWFTDHGIHEARRVDRGGVYYATADGSRIVEAVYGLDSPNGIGLSPDGSRLYVAETWSGRVWWWDVAGPGELTPAPGLVPHGGTLLVGLPGLQLFDSLAVDGEGHVCVATIMTAGISAISPDGADVQVVETGDVLTTNIAFGGDDLRTAFITTSATGRLVATDWPRPGLELAYNA